MNETELYRERVRAEIARPTGAPILNSSVEHAAILVQETLKAAKREFLILSDELDEDCFARDGVLHAAQRFLGDPDSRLHILVECYRKDPESNFHWYEHPFVAPLAHFASERCADGQSRLEIRRVKRDAVSRYSYNFFVGDDFGMRFQEDRAFPAAVAAYFPEKRIRDEKDPVTHLRSIFRELWKSDFSDAVLIAAQTNSPC